MKLDGFAIAGYRSFGPELVYINDLSKINIFIGKNNSGKSNILRFCSHIRFAKLDEKNDEGKNRKKINNDLDFCKTSPDKTIKCSLQLKKDSTLTGPVFEFISGYFPLIEIKEKQPHTFWLPYDIAKDSIVTNNRQEASGFASWIQKNSTEEEANNLSKKLLDSWGGGHAEVSLSIATHLLAKIELEFNLYYIEEFRKITGGEDANDYNGAGFIKKLRNLQNPELKSREVNKSIFVKINEFVQELLGESDAFLEIPANTDKIYVSIKEKILPLESLGTGIHELIILAVAVTIIDDSVVCIEEPEIHLHPELQKKFIRYIREETNNQYLISTHSNAFFDMDDVNIYHCRLKDGYTACDLVATRQSKSLVLADLGYKASDLLQSNCVIWVEGPSDRIYLNHWIRGKNPELVEGLHYSIMFYGGRLLNHLAFDDPEVYDFIQLCHLNRNAAILIDSDRKTPHSHLNKTKKRIIKDFENNNQLVWVTNGKEIENYLPEDIFNESVRAVHKNCTKTIKWDRFAKLTEYRKGKSIDKISVARKVADVDQKYSSLDLEKQISTLIEFIQQANKK